MTSQGVEQKLSYLKFDVIKSFSIFRPGMEGPLGWGTNRSQSVGDFQNFVGHCDIVRSEIVWFCFALRDGPKLIIFSRS